MADVTSPASPPSPPAETEPLLTDLTETQRQAVTHEGGPLLIVAGAGTGKTTVITRRIAWLIATQRAAPEQILALTFTEKAAAEMEERVDLLVPYGFVEVCLKTFHAFSDQLLREHAVHAGLSPNFRVLSQAEQIVFLRQHLFELPLERLRPLSEPGRFLDALATVWSRAKDEAVTPEEFLAYATRFAEQAGQAPDPAQAKEEAARLLDVARAYDAYQRLLHAADCADFGDQVLLAVRLLEQHPEVLSQVRARFRYLLVDEFQDTNYAQFRLLQLLAPPDANVTVVADDDQSIYQWRGAALSNVLKFLDHYDGVRTVVLTENFRSSQAILDCAYRLIRFNDPDRLEVRSRIDKRLIARSGAPSGPAPHLRVFDAVSGEADWVARTIREAVAGGRRRPGDFAILVRSNREADLFLRALNVAGVPWSFSGASGLFTRPESKMLLSCLKALADPEDSLSWYHVASSALYRIPMRDLAAVLAAASRTNRSVRAVLARLWSPPSKPGAPHRPPDGGRHPAPPEESGVRVAGPEDAALAEALSPEGAHRLGELLSDVERLLELSRTLAGGQLLYRWLADRGLLTALGQGERAEDAQQLQTIARFFDQLRRVEALTGGGLLPELLAHLELFQAMGNEPVAEDDAWADRVQVLTIHKAKGLEFSVVFLVGLVQGRFPTPKRRDPIELPEPLIKDILPQGDYHLQEERRLFYVGMTRAKDELYLTASYSYGGKTVRKISQFVLETLDLASPSPPAKAAGARELIEHSRAEEPLPVAEKAAAAGQPLRLDPHGADDYLTCPLKYRYSHILKVPVMRHHLVVYGTAVHKAIEAFFKSRLKGREMSEAELLQVFEQSWRAEGFLTREHEALRLAQGRETLTRFFAQQQASPEHPTLIEEKFRFPLDDLLIVGRWDHVDVRGREAVIVDYKSSDVHDQAGATRRARESFQLLVYALAWRTLRGQIPSVELRFLESGLTGSWQPDEEDLEEVRERLRQAAAGIRARRFRATPREHACRWCAFQSICPFAFHGITPA